MSPDVVVIGSINHDITVLTSRLPQPGETVMGRGHYWGPGGKGANQAVAAARLGADTVFIAKLGDDGRGAALRATLRAEGIDDTFVGVASEMPTGLAVITVDDNAENTIVVSPGANKTLSPEEISRHESAIAGAGVVLAQLEVPIETIIAAATVTEGTFCLNPAPAAGDLPDELLNQVDVLVPNRTELEVLSGRSITDTIEETVSAVYAISGPKAFVVTLGSEGALVVEGDEVTEIPPVDIIPVDPTGAGDAFCGMLAMQLSRGRTLAEAGRQAAIAGALAVTREGAMEAMPTAAEVEELSR